MAVTQFENANKVSHNGDDAEMVRMRLQQAYQAYNQMMTVLSAIMKTQHDTAKAMINNMKP